MILLSIYRVNSYKTKIDFGIRYIRIKCRLILRSTILEANTCNFEILRIFGFKVKRATLFSAVTIDKGAIFNQTVRKTTGRGSVIRMVIDRSAYDKIGITHQYEKRRIGKFC